MRLFLYGISAFYYWLGAPLPLHGSNRVGARAFVRCAPSEETLARVSLCFPALPKPLHVAITGYHQRPVEGAVRHQCGKLPAGKIFYRIEDGIYAPCPELCFVQLADSLPFHELIRAGSALCGTFRLNAQEGGALESRSALTTKQQLGAFLRANDGLRGVRNARRALPQIVDGAASPPEIFLAMVLGLPFRYGGFQVEGLKVNYRLQPTGKAQAISGRKTLVPDLLLPRERLAIEYDSTAEHATAAQLTRDAQKRLALEADGYKVITVTAKQLASREEMHRIAQQIYRHRGKRLRPQSNAFVEQQRRLFGMGWSLDA